MLRTMNELLNGLMIFLSIYIFRFFCYFALLKYPAKRKNKMKTEMNRENNKLTKLNNNNNNNNGNKSVNEPR